jgi:hypothetical protein
MRATTIARGALIAALAAACRHAPEPEHPSVLAPSRGQRDEITTAEIRSVLLRASTAYDLAKLLRPRMLLQRPVNGVEPLPILMANEMRGVHVHLDDTQVGGLDLLSRISAQEVVSIRWLSPPEASTSYGNGHTAGVIAVLTQMGRR